MRVWGYNPQGRSNIPEGGWANPVSLHGGFGVQQVGEGFEHSDGMGFLADNMLQAEGPSPGYATTPLNALNEPLGGGGTSPKAAAAPWGLFAALALVWWWSKRR